MDELSIYRRMPFNCLLIVLTLILDEQSIP